MDRLCKHGLVLIKMLVELEFEALIFQPLHLGSLDEEIFVCQRRS
jgi:hypothetical protein